MTGINDLKGKVVAILGLGKSGMSAAKALKKNNISVIAFDSKIELQEQAKNLGVKIQDLETVDFSTIDILVISPSIPHTFPKPHPVVKLAKKHNVPVISDIELFINTYKDANYIGITGTNGKSTTTALIYHILKENNIPCEIGGNFGIPVFDLSALDNDGYYVLEMSSYQLEITPSLDFDFSILLNITPDHLDHHGGMDGYIAAKKLIFNHKTKNNFTNIIAVDDKYTQKIFDELKKQNDSNNISVSFSNNPDADYYISNGNLIDNTDNKNEIFMNLSNLDNLKGIHNWQNILCSIACVKKIIPDTNKIIAAIKTYKPLEHRIETVGKINGITFINDSKATNAESVIHAISSLKDIYFIIGGRKKEGGISILLPEISKGNIKKIFTIGESEDEFYNDTKDLVDTYKCHNLEIATTKAFELAIEDLKNNSDLKPIILLSPATASFDQYSSFEERGKHFKQIFKNLQEKYNKKL